MLGLASGSAALRSVRVRSADGDALRVRRGFERALAGVEWMPPGMPAGGITRSVWNSDDAGNLAATSEKRGMTPPP